MPVSIDLASRVRRPSKRPIALANIAPTQAQAADLLALYGRVLAVWIRRIPGVIAEYERSIGELQTDSASTTGGEIDGIAAEIQRLVLLLTPDLRDWALRVEGVMRGKWIRSVLSATDVDLNTILTAGDVEDTVDAAIQWNVALIKDISTELQRKIANAVFSGFQGRTPAANIAKEISEATGMARARARRVAGDQVVKLGARLNEARRQQAGIRHWKWRSSHKLHYRPIHQARDGKIYTDQNAPADKPGMLPFCGCTAQAVLVFED